MINSKSSDPELTEDATKKLNTIGSATAGDEDLTGMRSDMGSKYITETKTPKETIERLREKIWRRSHSLKSVETFDDAMRSFEKFLSQKDMTFDECLRAPIQALDDFGAWLDAGHSPRTTETYVHFAKKSLKFLGAHIDGDSFREKVTIPKKRPFQDDKVTKDQIRRIVLGLKHLGLKTLLMLIKDTQARPGELLGLRVSDFNVAHDPPYLNMPAEMAKNDMPRELFFTEETKQMLVSLIKSKSKKQNDFLYLPDGIDPVDEKTFQKKLDGTANTLGRNFRALLAKPQFSDMRETVSTRGMTRYKIHIYSFKKFAFTVMADELGEIAARAIKGDREYVLTYYRKSREERATDYRKVVPKISVFGSDERSKVRDQIAEKVRSMKDDDLARLQKFLRTAKAKPGCSPVRGGRESDQRRIHFRRHDAKRKSDSPESLTGRKKPYKRF